MTSSRRPPRTSEPASFAFDDDGIARPLAPLGNAAGDDRDRQDRDDDDGERKRTLCRRCGNVHVEGRVCP